MHGRTRYTGKHVKLIELNETGPKTYTKQFKTYKTHTFLKKNHEDHYFF